VSFESFATVDGGRPILGYMALYSIDRLLERVEFITDCLLTVPEALAEIELGQPES
jgi:hypothetical protein